MTVRHVTFRLPVLIPALCVLLLAGCWNGRVLFAFEQPYWSSIGGDLHLHAELVGAAAARGYLPRFDVAPAGMDPLAALSTKLGSGRYGAAIVGPLLSFQWESFAAAHPRTRFVLVDAPLPGGTPPPNTVFLIFDRSGAFRDAGRAAGEDIRKRFGAADASRLGSRIAILTSPDSDISASEVEAFTRGVADALDGGQPESRSIPASADAAATTAAVGQMKRAGAEIFLLGLGQRAAAGLEAVRAAGGLAIMADWLASRSLPAQVMLSVENDVPGGITLALDALRSGIARVQGPVRLVSGKKI